MSADDFLLILKGQLGMLGVKVIEVALAQKLIGLWMPKISACFWLTLMKRDRRSLK